MSFKEFIRRTSKAAKRRSPEIFAGLALIGLGATVVATFEASPGISETLANAKEEMEKIDSSDADDETKKQEKNSVRKEAAKSIVLQGLPIFIAVLMTGSCIIASNRVSNGRIKAWAVYSASQSAALMDYKKRVKDYIGDKKNQSFHEGMVKDIIDEKLSSTEPIRTGRGDDLICESLTGQLIYSDIQWVKDRWLEVKEQLQEGEDICLSDWLYDIGCERSVIANLLYWWVDKEKGRENVSMSATCVMAANQKPAYYLVYDRPPEYERDMHA